MCPRSCRLWPGPRLVCAGMGEGGGWRQELRDPAWGRGTVCELKTNPLPLPAILSSPEVDDDEEEGLPDYENLQGLN